MKAPISITLMSGPRDGDTLYFHPSDDEQFTLTLGRRDGCDICLNYDSQVSRTHAQLLFEGNRLWLEDLDSRNGTFYSAQPVKGRVEIQAGTLFKVGRTWLRVDPRRPDETQTARAIMDDSIDPLF